MGTHQSRPRSQDSSGLRPSTSAKACAFGAGVVACVCGCQVAGHGLGQRRLEGGCHPDDQDHDDADSTPRLYLLRAGPQKVNTKDPTPAEIAGEQQGSGVATCGLVF
jgi:hypothetical protein